MLNRTLASYRLKKTKYSRTKHSKPAIKLKDFMRGKCQLLFCRIEKCLPDEQLKSEQAETRTKNVI